VQLVITKPLRYCLKLTGSVAGFPKCSVHTRRALINDLRVADFAVAESAPNLAKAVVGHKDSLRMESGARRENVVADGDEKLVVEVDARRLRWLFREIGTVIVDDNRHVVSAFGPREQSLEVSYGEHDFRSVWFRLVDFRVPAVFAIGEHDVAGLEATANDGIVQLVITKPLRYCLKLTGSVAGLPKRSVYARRALINDLRIADFAVAESAPNLAKAVVGHKQP
jgi:hypothetical protein